MGLQRHKTSEVEIFKQFELVGEVFLQNFYEDLFEELSKYGEIESLNVCDNLADHMVGNVYVQFREEEHAANALRNLTGRFYAGRPIIVDFSPVTDFREATCRQYEENTCNRGGYCNFMHLKQISRELRRKLFGGSRRHRRSHSRSRSPHGHRGYEDRPVNRGHGRRHPDRDQYSEERIRKPRSRSPGRRRNRSRSPGGRRNRSPIREGSAERRAKIEQWNREREQTEATRRNSEYTQNGQQNNDYPHQDQESPGVPATASTHPFLLNELNFQDGRDLRIDQNLPQQGVSFMGSTSLVGLWNAFEI
ncbi:hypothetical protein ZIOFF_033280 [Zingiber officinale]|uniref:Uncharacterized protein n=1 Tax=Zingiber officinale TaxID=94328 RepID=A0A8J5GI28_ZINOF|nr:hypothetical protein ZIOFF_033280 [Zingiber officinale]